jgi:hypothetical protein
MSIRSRTVLALSAVLALAAAAPSAHAVGGSGGTPFSIQCSASEDLTQIIVRAGSRIDAIGIECRGPGSFHRYTQGGNGGSRHEVLEESERVKEIRGFAGTCKKKKSPRVCALRFAVEGAARSLSPQYGNYASGSDDFTFKIPDNRELFGFAGRSGKELDAIEPLTRPRNQGNQRRSIDVGPFVQALNVALGGTDVRLSNRGERHGNSWLREDDSWVSLFGATRRFTLPEKSVRRRNGLYRHFFYANDVNSTKADVATNRNAFVLRVNFEETGTEIKGLCRYKRPSGSYGQCPGANEGDGNTPDANWSQPRLDITLLPGVRGGDLVFSASSVHVRGDFKLNGPCGSGNECKRLLGDWEAQLKDSAEQVVRDILNLQSVRDAEARVTRPLLRAAGISAPLVSAGLDGSRLILTY